MLILLVGISLIVISPPAAAEPQQQSHSSSSRAEFGIDSGSEIGQLAFNEFANLSSHWQL